MNLQLQSFHFKMGYNAAQTWRKICNVYGVYVITEREQSLKSLNGHDFDNVETVNDTYKKGYIFMIWIH